MKNNNKKLYALLALTLGILFAVVIAELMLQLLDFPPRTVSGWLNCKSKNPDQCNSMGFRSREINYSDDDFVVVLLGDSEVYASALSFEQMPERRLEHFLKKYRENVKVFTIGDMGYGQDQQYLALKKYFKKHRADLVLLMFTARNDIENNIFPASGGIDSIKPTFWLEKNGELRGPTEKWLEPADSWFKLVLLWQYYFGKQLGKSRLEIWEKDILPAPYRPLNNYQGEVDYSWQEIWTKHPQRAYKGLDIERIGPGNKFTPRSERRKYGINLTRKLFSEIKELTEANNGHFIIFKETRPWELDNNGLEKVYYLKGKYYKLSIKQYQDNLGDILDGYEHYNIPLNLEKYTKNSEDFHLSHEAIDKLMEKLSLIISKKQYFIEE